MGRRASSKSTPEKEVNDLAKAIFLAQLADAGMVTESAQAAGVDRKTVYNWRKNDKEFAQAWDDALEAGTEILEREAARRAVDGVEEPVIYQGQPTPLYERNQDGSLKYRTVMVDDGQGGKIQRQEPVPLLDEQGNPKFLTIRKPSDTLMIFLLKARRPDKYRERFTAELTGKGGKDLPAPGVQAGVLVVPGIMQDPNAWSAAVQEATPKPE